MDATDDANRCQRFAAAAVVRPFECESAAYNHRGIFTGTQELVSVVQDHLTCCACYKSGTRAESRIRVIRVFAQLNDVGSALYFTQETMMTRIWNFNDAHVPRPWPLNAGQVVHEQSAASLNLTLLSTRRSLPGQSFLQLTGDF